MLADLENSLVALLKNSPIAQRMTEIDALPDLDGDSLIGRFATKAPAIYVALGSFKVSNGRARPKFGIACIAKNSRGHKAVRHGDGQQIGLYTMLDAVLALVDGATLACGEHSTAVDVFACDILSSEDLFRKGVYAGVVQLEARTEILLPALLDPSKLAEFKTFHADYDIDPHQASTEHTKWLQEPANQSTSKPELSDTLNVRS